MNLESGRFQVRQGYKDQVVLQHVDNGRHGDFGTVHWLHEDVFLDAGTQLGNTEAC